jgi:hypothetical protein
MDNIFFCPSCKKTFIGEEANSHKCNFDVVEIPVSDYFIREKPTKTSIVAWGVNGKVYRLTKEAAPTVAPTAITRNETPVQITRRRDRTAARRQKA